MTVHICQCKKLTSRRLGAHVYVQTLLIKDRTTPKNTNIVSGKEFQEYFTKFTVRINISHTKMLLQVPKIPLASARAK